MFQKSQIDIYQLMIFFAKPLLVIAGWFRNFFFDPYLIQIDAI